MEPDKLIEEMKEKMVKATGADPDLLIIYSQCHSAPVLKLACKNEYGYIYVCAQCMEPISVICCKINRRPN